MTEKDPNAGLFGDPEEDNSEQELQEYVFGKNPNRVEAICDLWYDDLMAKVKGMNLPDAAGRFKAVFEQCIGGLLDMFADSQDPESAPYVMNDLDTFIAVALVNKKEGFNLFVEQEKIFDEVKRDAYPDDEAYAKALSERAEQLWARLAPVQKEYNLGTTMFDTEEEVPSDAVLEFVFGRNPDRMKGIADLWYDGLVTKVKEMKLPDEDAECNAVFKMCLGGLLDMIADSQDPEDAPDVMNDFDMSLALAIVNHTFGIDILEEQRKALETVDRSRFETDEEYAEALSRAEDVWWEIPQPLLNKRNPNDALRETLRKYGLTL